MITPWTNTTLEEIARVFGEHRSFVICGHVDPDGDCIGSQSALAHILESLGKEVTCVLVNQDFIEDNLLFLPGTSEMVAAAAYRDTPEVFVAVDVPTVDRIGDAEPIQKRSEITVTLDHHAVDSVMSRYSYTDPAMASTSMLVWELAKLFEASNDKRVALCTYTGLATDTGGFRFQNSDKAAFVAAAEMVGTGIDPAFVATQVFQSRSLASLKLEALILERMVVAKDNSYIISYLTLDDFERGGAQKADSDPLINVLRSLKGTQVACVLREQSDGVRGSIRSKDDTDVAAIARLFDGGGHRAAAGFSVCAPMAEAFTQVISVLDEHVQGKVG